MADRETLKREILEFLDAQDETVLMPEADKDWLRERCEALCPFTAEPRPIVNQAAAEGVWRSRFASFGAKHSESQPLRHTSSLMLQSFGNLPNIPVHVTRLHQEIDVATHAYNNVVFVENEDRSASGVIVMRGTYSGNADEPKRYQVAFHHVSLNPAPGESESSLRDAFGLADEVELAKEFKPPSLHSDIVYVDEDMRINFGGLGGFYVLEKIDQEPFSIGR